MQENDVFNAIVRNINEVIPELENHEYKYSDRLVDLGANSIDRAEIVTLTLEDLSLNIPRVELFGVKSIGELSTAIYEKYRSLIK
jgi:polyketide biosynthesis acyl carrier protein